MQSKFDLKPQVWFQIKIAWHEVQSQLYYSHFEIVEFSQYQYLIGLVAVLLEKKKQSRWAWGPSATKPAVSQCDWE